MLKPQRKLSKKEIKEDKFVKKMMDTRVYIEENSKKLSIIGAVVFALVIAVMAYNYMHSETVQKSSTLLGEAQLEYYNQNLSKAEALLTRLLDEFSDTDAGAKGRFLLANIYYEQNKIAEAKENYFKFIEEYNGSSILLASGYAGYAACLEKEKNFLEAGDYYMKARNMNKDFVEAADYLYLAALNYISAQAYDQARDALQLIEEQYKDSPRVKDARGQLIIIAGKK